MEDLVFTSPSFGLSAPAPNDLSVSVNDGSFDLGPTQIDTKHMRAHQFDLTFIGSILSVWQRGGF
jgi:hypothetical protein